MTKKELRAIYKEKRNQLSASQKAKLDDLLLIQFQKLDIDIPSVIMTYAALETTNEFDPYLVTDYCAFKNPDQTLIYPVAGIDNYTIQPVIVDEATLFEKNKYGIDEPINGSIISIEDIELVIVPLLYFDINGNRVGYGKGYYDRFLKNCNEDVLKIGFNYFDPVALIDDVNEYDVKLDYCITPTAIFAFE